MTVGFGVANWCLVKSHTGKAVEILEKKYTDIQSRRMPHNRNETTLFMRKR